MIEKLEEINIRLEKKLTQIPEDKVEKENELIVFIGESTEEIKKKLNI
jgi:hypothetical protein